MNALLLVANALALHATETPLVLDGCNTASAERAAAIAEMSPADPRTLDAVADLLNQRGGSICLMESWTLVKVHNSQDDHGIIEAALAKALASDEAYLAERAARLTRVLGVSDAAGFRHIVWRADLSPVAMNALGSEIAAMPASPRKAALAAALDRAVAIAR